MDSSLFELVKALLQKEDDENAATVVRTSLFDTKSELFRTYLSVENLKATFHTSIELENVLGLVLQFWMNQDNVQRVVTTASKAVFESSAEETPTDPDDLAVFRLVQSNVTTDMKHAFA